MAKSDPNQSNNLASLHRLYLKRRAEIHRRLSEFQNVKPGEYFYEILYCLLTPQSNASNAIKVVKELKKQNFYTAGINPEPILSNPKCYIRFHRTKAKYLVRLKRQYPAILQMLLNSKSTHELRQWLVKNVNGFGWKEASHFLRNIGYRDLAILDRHILRYLQQFNVICKLPKTLNPKKYLQIEENFRNFSNKTGIPMDELDLLFWSMGTGIILK